MHFLKKSRSTSRMLVVHLNSRQSFAGHVVGSQPMKRKKKSPNNKRILCLFSTNCIENINKLIINNVTV